VKLDETLGKVKAVESIKTRPKPASFLMNVAELLGLFSFVFLFVGPLVALPRATSTGSFPDILSGAVLAFGLPAGMLLMACLLGRLAILVGWVPTPPT
jgi:hypothetical protein